MTTLPSTTRSLWRRRVGPGAAPAGAAGAGFSIDERTTEPTSPRVEPSERSDAWVTCTACGMEVRADRLHQHRATQH